MGQKVHPVGFRLGIIRDWDAKWFATGKNYATNLVADQKSDASSVAHCQTQRSAGLSYCVLEIL
ncbi:MAG: hypothetical protein CM1200mP41_16390 [Gammaproteobacteria bacterium]|nr:MAG: hypothetical protein CM1200mP41_16390 [Gammaproteobacteria bacterium]